MIIIKLMISIQSNNGYILLLKMRVNNTQVTTINVKKWIPPKYN